MSECPKFDYLGFPETCEVCGAKATFTPTLHPLHPFSGYECGVWVDTGRITGRRWLVTPPSTHEIHERHLRTQLAQALAILRAANFCEAHLPDPGESEKHCPACLAVHENDLRVKAEAEVERVMKANGFYFGRAEKAETEVKRLRAAIREALRHDLAPGGWGGPAAENILTKALAAKEGES